MNPKENRRPTQDTLAYYDQNAAAFTLDTVSAEIGSLQNEFLSYLPAPCAILDLGCGSGRDSKYFADRGCDVTAVDGSEELCRIAGRLTGRPVIHAAFQDYVPDRMFDGIWACSSLLHLPYREWIAVMERLMQYLSPCGVFYLSFKYGDFEGMRNGRFFLDLDERRFGEAMAHMAGLSVIRMGVTPDVRPGRETEKWLNVFLRKMGNDET